jgi:hypothetical protein
MLRDCVATLAKDRGFTTMLEPELADGRADLALIHPTLPEPIVIDFTITNTAATSQPTAAQAEARKKRRYGKSDLVVAQADVTGGMSKGLCDCIKTIATDKEDLHEIAVKISKVIQKGNSRILIDDRDRRSAIALTALNVNTPNKPPKNWSATKPPKHKRPHDDPQTPSRPTVPQPDLEDPGAQDTGGGPPAQQARTTTPERLPTTLNAKVWWPRR